MCALLEALIFINITLGMGTKWTGMGWGWRHHVWRWVVGTILWGWGRDGDVSSSLCHSL